MVEIITLKLAALLSPVAKFEDAITLFEVARLVEADRFVEAMVDKDVAFESPVERLVEAITLFDVARLVDADKFVEAITLLLVALLVLPEINTLLLAAFESEVTRLELITTLLLVALESEADAS